MKLINGNEISSEILNNLKKNIEKSDFKPGLAVVLIGNDEASKIYVQLKEKAAKEIGVNFFKYLFDENESEETVLSKIQELNSDKNVSGMIVQLPLPEKFDTQKIINAIDPKKDVDGFHPENVRNFFSGKGKVTPVFPGAIIKMINSAINKNGLKPKTAIVIANSDRFGEVMTVALRKENLDAKYVYCEDIIREKENNGGLVDYLREADVIVTACGVLNLLNKGMAKAGAIIIDGGIVKKDRKVVGDVDFEDFRESDCYITPVPGGVGPVTVACLLENVCLFGLKK